MMQVLHGLLADFGVLATMIGAWSITFPWTQALYPAIRSAVLILAAGICVVALMSFPIVVEPGVIQDLRAVPIALAGFLRGPLVGIAVALIAALYRLYLGGIGAHIALISMAVVCAIGLIGHVLLRGRRPGLWSFVLLGAAAAPGSLAGAGFLPAPIRAEFFEDFALISIAMIFIGIVGVGMTIANELSRLRSASENQLYRALMDAFPEPLNAKDPEGRFIAANPATADHMRADAAQNLIGRSDADFFAEDIARDYRKDEEDVLVSGRPTIVEQYVERSDGTSAWVSTFKVPLLDRNGTVQGLMTHNRDISELKRLRDEHHLARQQLQDALATMEDGLAVFDARQRLVLCNGPFRSLLPTSDVLHLPGTPLEDILRASVASGTVAGLDSKGATEWVDRMLSLLGQQHKLDVETSDGRCFLVRVKPGPNGNSLIILSDVTSERQSARQLVALNRQLEELAHLDGLTGVANRRAFDEAFTSEFRQTARTGAPFSLLLMDIDSFKAFNDLYGHIEGDNCLRSVGRVIQASLFRPRDLAARYGGEEFAAILPDTDAPAASAVAERVRSVVRGLAITHQRSAHAVVTISIGAVTVRGAHPDLRPSDVLERADEALYAAKASGRDTVRVADDLVYLPSPPAGGVMPSSIPG